jgi:hypothetical protein
LSFPTRKPSVDVAVLLSPPPSFPPVVTSSLYRRRDPCRTSTASSQPSTTALAASLPRLHLPSSSSPPHPLALNPHQAPMESTEAGPCCVCGATTTQRCSSCLAHGFSLFVCGKEHQKLVRSPPFLSLESVLTVLVDRSGSCISGFAGRT